MSQEVFFICKFYEIFISIKNFAKIMNFMKMIAKTTSLVKFCLIISGAKFSTVSLSALHYLVPAPFFFLKR